MPQFIEGPRFMLVDREPQFPEALKLVPRPPKQLYGVGNPQVLRPGLAVVGARKATPYGVPAVLPNGRRSGGSPSCPAARAVATARPIAARWTQAVQRWRS